MNINELVREFAENVAAQKDAIHRGETQASNEHARRYISAFEQLRALAHGIKIKVVEACTPSTGVDTFADLERVRELVGAQTSDVRTQTV